MSSLAGREFAGFYPFYRRNTTDLVFPQWAEEGAYVFRQ